MEFFDFPLQNMPAPEVFQRDELRMSRIIHTVKSERLQKACEDKTFEEMNLSNSHFDFDISVDSHFTINEKDVQSKKSQGSSKIMIPSTKSVKKGFLMNESKAKTPLKKSKSGNIQKENSK